MKINVCTLLVASFFLLSCEKEKIDASQINNSDLSNVQSNSDEYRKQKPIILGNQKNNPFSVQNMKIALDSLQAYAHEENDGSLSLKSLEQIEIKPTDLYVRFLPIDSVQYKKLTSDTTLTLFDFPLDYEIKQNGDYYRDPAVITPYTWQYTTVKPGYVPPKGMQYEVLSELFIIENSEDYTEQIITDTTIIYTKSSKNGCGIIDRNIGNSLYAISFTLTGNKKDLQESKNIVDEKLKTTVANCTKYCVGRSWWKTCWTSCDPYYYPDGYIKLQTPNGDRGLKGVKVRMWRWFTYADARTNEQGYYSCSERFNSIWIGNNIDYQIVFDGKNENNTWTFSKSIAGAVCLWTNYYGVGSNSPNGHNVTFKAGSDCWGRCVLSNAIYDYCTIAKAEGISLPPYFLDIANKETDNFTASAPLLNNHINWSIVKAFPNFWGVVGQLFAYSILGWGYPDLILRYTNNIHDYEHMISVAWHELTHASQLNRMIAEKGMLWASDYWSSNVYQQVSNELNSGSAYGEKGDERWQMIALSEGWANYRAWKMSNDYMKWPDALNYLSDYDGFARYFSERAFPVTYGEMFDDLIQAGCSYNNIEKALCGFSIQSFKDELYFKYPQIKNQITKIINYYE